MNLRSLLSTIVLFGFSAHIAYGQCEVIASVSPGTTVCGDCAELSTYGQGQGQQVFNEDFNSGTPTGWAFTQQADFSNPCNSSGVNGTTHIWMGSNSAVPRALETVTYDFTSAVAGVTVCFDMLFAEQGGTAPCEGPDEPDEGVSLQYSPDGGSTWIELQYFDPNGGNDADLVNWNNWCVQLPAGAIGPTTRIRWFQDNDSGADYDHWGIDNVEVYYNDPTYQITWQHDNYSYPVGSSGGVDPTKVCPQTQTDYIVIMTNGTFSCADTVTLNVDNPVIEVDAGNDTTICPSTCAVLDGTAKVIKKPAKTATYSNAEVKEVVGTPAIPFINPVGEAKLEMNINITDLNMTTVLPNSITEVCMNLAMLPFPGSTIDGFRVRLICPDGSYIDLVAANTTSGQLYNNTCFVPAGASIPASNGSYSGSYAPNQPFNDLVGCTANGVWSIEFYNAITTISLPVGFFYGWSITFDDPEINYTADVSWTPTTNMTGANTLNPTVCPTTSTTYTLTATDTAGCITVTDTVRVNVQPCCNLEYNSNSVDPTCGNNDGSIQINVVSGSGNYSYLWGGGQTSNPLTNIGPGTYTVTITDNGQANCVKDTTITLSTTFGPVVDSITTTPETCLGDGDGTVSVYATGSGLLYQWDDPNNSTTATVSNLAPGTYNVTVQDGAGCSSTANISVQAGPDCCVLDVDFSYTDPTSCATPDGSVSVNILQGSGSYGYIWTGPVLAGLPVFTNLQAGTYSLTIIDSISAGCQFDTTFTLTTPNAPVIDSVTSVTEVCLGDNDGSVTVYATGGTGALTYLWNDANNSTAATVSNLAPGTYDVTVSDASGCSAISSIVLAAGPPCCNLDFTASTTPPTCGASDGEILVTVTQGSGNYTYTWTGSLSGNNPTGLASGSYTVTITDLGQTNCQRDTTINLSSIGAPVIDSIVTTDETCAGSADGTATVYATGGSGALTYDWSSGGATSGQTGLSAGIYAVTVEDAVGCQAVGSDQIFAPTALQLSAILTQPSCFNNDGAIDVTVTGGTATYSYAWVPQSGGPVNTSEDLSALAGDTYNVTVTDNAGCTLDTSFTLNTGTQPVISVTATNESCLGFNNGSVTANITGGSTGFSFLWSNGSTAQNLTNVAAGTYSVVATDANGCTATGSSTVAAGPLCCQLNATAVDLPAYCGQSNGSLTVIVDSTTGPPPYTYELMGVSAAGPSNQFNGLPSGLHSVIVTDVNGCIDTMVGSITEILNNMTMSIDANSPTCAADSDGDAAALAQGGTLPYTYSWNNGDTNFQASNLPVGQYNVVVTDANGCTIQESTLLSTNPILADLVKDESLCEGTSILLDAGAAVTYNWSTGETEQTIEVSDTGMYFVTITDTNGCEITDTSWVSFRPGFVVDAGLDTSIDYATSTDLEANISIADSGTYSWSPDFFLSCNDCALTMATPDTTTLFFVSYTSEQGCVGTDSVLVEVLEEPYVAVMPSAFSPNGDGQNDVLYLYHSGTKEVYWLIFDRWGEKVFETRDPDQGWDGTYKGKLLAPGTFVHHFVVKFKNNTSKRASGSTTLLR